MYSSTCWHGDTRRHSAPCKSTAKFSNVHVVHLHFKVVTAVTASGITCFLFVFLLRLHNRDITSLEKCPPVTCFQISVRLNSLLRNRRKSNCSDFFFRSRPWYLIICCKHRAQRAVFFFWQLFFFYNHKRILYSVCLVHKPVCRRESSGWGYWLRCLGWWTCRRTAGCSSRGCWTELWTAAGGKRWTNQKRTQLTAKEIQHAQLK